MPWLRGSFLMPCSNCWSRWAPGYALNSAAADTAHNPRITTHSMGPFVFILHLLYPASPRFGSPFLQNHGPFKAIATFAVTLSSFAVGCTEIETAYRGRVPVHLLETHVRADHYPH